ncbi:MAG: CARDB domain-containing protein [Methanomassiliicoccales archaeon]
MHCIVRGVDSALSSKGVVQTKKTLISLIAILSLTAIILVAYPVSAVEGGPIYVSIEGRNVVATGETWQYVVTVIGGPGVQTGGNFSYTAELVGLNVTDSLVDPSSGVSSSGVFNMSVTLPPLPQDVTLVLNIISSAGLDSEKTVKTFPIKVLTPVVIQAAVKNTGDFGVEGMPVSFYADGAKVYETTVDIDAQSSKTIRYNWTDPQMSSGQHVITVMLDPNNKFVKFSSGGSVFTTTIYVGKSSYGTTDTLLGILFVISVVLALIVYSRPKKRRMR